MNNFYLSNVSHTTVHLVFVTQIDGVVIPVVLLPFLWYR